MKFGVLHNTASGQAVGLCIGRADSSFARAAGLLGRASLRAGEGIWIVPSSGVHTFAMRFAIDVLGLDGDLRVIRLWPRLKPWRIPMPSLQVRSVVELAEGEIERLGIVAGDQLGWRAIA